MRLRFLSPLLLAGSLVLLLATVALAAELDESRRTLKEIQRRIAETTRNLEAKTSAERSLAEGLQAVESELSKLDAHLTEQRHRLKAVEIEIGTREEEVAVARKAIAGTETDVRRRLSALYKGGETGVVKILFSPSSPARMAQDYDFLGRIVRRDRELLASYRRQLGMLQTALAELSESRRQQQATLELLSENEKTARQARRLKEELLGQVRRDRQALSAALAELRERAGRLNELVKKLESAKSREYTEKSGVFTARKGQLPWPVEGSIRVGFGAGRHPDLGTMYDSKGIEIAAASDDPIRAVAPGRVLFANWFKGYGNLLILDHGESYYSLYAQAARLNKKVGDQAVEGEILGYAGLQESQGIYFEIRRGGSPLDPTAWLKQR